MISIEISEFKQQLLWEKIIIDWLEEQSNVENTDYINSSLSLSSWQLANKAREACNILQSWNISLSKIKKYCLNQESRAFLDWWNSYQLICDSFDLPTISKTIFDNSNKFMPLELSKPKLSNPELFKIECRDFVHEINLAACWASNKDLVGDIGVVVLDLDKKYSQVDYIFSNIFSEIEYNIDISIKLKNFLLVDIALLILQIANCYITKENIKYEDFSKLLRTKFIFGGTLELGSRSYIDYILREKVDYKFNWQYIKNNLSKISQQNDSYSINLFITLCDKFTIAIDNRNLIGNLATKYSCDYWVKFIQEILQIFGWGEENIDIQEQHIVYCWQDMLNQYIELESFLGKHDLTECIKILVKLSKLYNVTKTNNFLNSSKDRQQKSINILSLSSAIQSKFDYLWVCGLSETNWLPEDQFNPFLPIVLQKQFGIDSVNIEKNKYFQQLINITNKQFICSYPLYIDNNLVRHSQLINDFPEFVANLSLKTDQKNKLKPDLEIYIDDNAPIYKKNIFSGTKFLKLQAACPFQANAKIRMQAYCLEKPASYLSKSIKGEILHKTLAQFWLKYKNSSVLKQLPINIIKQELFSITNEILYDFKKNKPTTLNAAIIQLETNRIANLCFDFIKKYDLTRAEFFVIHLEEKFTVKLQEFLINVKLDRIDQLTNGDLLVIDYKTGQTSMGIWDPNSLDDPQLPIYSLCLGNIKGLILAVIRTDKLELLAMLEHKLDLANLADIKYICPPNWNQHLELWHKNLYKLATEFKNGLAIVDPKYGSITCRTCDLKYICRVFAKNSFLNNNIING